MFSEGRRKPMKVQTCGRAATNCWIDIRRVGALHNQIAEEMGFPITDLQVPICDTCIDNLGYAPELIFPLKR